MHVLIIPSWYPRHPGDIGGSFFREQALALDKNGCKVGVIYPEMRSLRNWRSIFSGSNGVSFEQDEGVKTYRTRGMNWFPRTVVPTSKLFVWHGRRIFERYVAENGMPDIIHVHSILYAGCLAAEIFKKYAVPFVITEHSSAFARELISLQALSIARKITSLAAKKFAVSSAFVNLLNEKTDSGNVPWEEMPNVVSEQFLNCELSLRKNIDYFRFINIALMTENKDQANIISAFAEVSKDYKNIQLTMGGDGPERCKLEKLARDLGVFEKTKFTGLLSRAQVLTEVAAADAFILASRYETFGVVVIEALALGKPVIATRCGGPESIMRGEDGILIPVNDVRELAAAMCRVLENRKAYDPVEIRQACIARYSSATVASRLKKAYEEVVNKNEMRRSHLGEMTVLSSVDP